MVIIDRHDPDRGNVTDKHSTDGQDIKWTCQKCGTCCRFAGLITHPLDRGDGVCKYLDENNLCSIYEDRPDMCRTWAGDDKQRIDACNYLRELYLHVSNGK